MKRVGLFMIVCFIFGAPFVHGASVEIELNSGKVVTGEVLEETDKDYRLMVQGTEITLEKDLVRSVEEIPSAAGGAVAPPSLGRIRGQIILPAVQKSGHLYVWFSPVSDGLEFPGRNKYFQAIPSGAIKGDRIDYAIDQVPPGQYQGYVTWDVAEPLWKESWGKGNYPAYPGDYTGATQKTVEVTEDQETQQVDIECVYHLRPVGREKE